MRFEHMAAYVFHLFDSINCGGVELFFDFYILYTKENWAEFIFDYWQTYFFSYKNVK